MNRSSHACWGMQKVTFPRSAILLPFFVAGVSPDGLTCRLIDSSGGTHPEVQQRDLAPFPLYEVGQECQYGIIKKLHYLESDEQWQYETDNGILLEKEIVLKVKI